MFWTIIGIVGAALVGALGLFSRQAGKNSEKAKVATAAAATEQRMAQAAADAPRTTAQVDETLRQGKF